MKLKVDRKKKPSPSSPRSKQEKLNANPDADGPRRENKKKGSEVREDTVLPIPPMA